MIDYDDLVVLAKGSNKIHVYYGFVNGYLNLDAEIEKVGGTIAVEDINGDEYDDLIVGDYGKVIYYFGGPDKGDFGNNSYSFLISESRTMTYVAAAGDYDGDGFNDVMIDVPAVSTSYVVFGFPSGTAIPEKDPRVVSRNEFLIAQGTLGDVNKDGYNDVIFRLDYLPLQPREVVISLGPNPDLQNPDWSIKGTEAGSSSSFGNAFGTAGDINGDGYIDIFIGDPLYNPTPSDPSHLGNWGKVYIWFGGPATANDPTGFGENPLLADADFTINGNFASGSFGYAVASGDINGDHYSDLAVGDPRAASYCFDPETELQDYTETGVVTPYFSGLAPPDHDKDGIPDNADNCLNLFNPGQANADMDEHGDECDNCIFIKNNDQDDSDHDQTGDLCDECTRDPGNDVDHDGYCAGIGYMSPKTGDQDNCPDTYNPDQLDQDNDGLGDLCDEDDDGDEVNDLVDNCPIAFNPSQADMDMDGLGDACDDIDGDGITDAMDNCPFQENSDQADLDEDGFGDICDNCPDIPNSPSRGTCSKSGNICVTDAACGYNGTCIMTQIDSDLDGLGDACDSDDDSDGIPDSKDNCRINPNPDQEDTDGDGTGDACNDAFDQDGDDWADNLDNCPEMKNRAQTDNNNNGIGDSCEFDLTVSRIEITQAIQDHNNSVPLISGKDTWIRVYFDVGQAGYPLGPVSGTIRFKYENNLPMYTYVNGRAKDMTVYSESNIIAVPKPDPANVGHTLNFKIPKNWQWDAVPYLHFSFANHDTLNEIDPWNYYPKPVPLKFNSVRDLNIMFVPVTLYYPNFVAQRCSTPTDQDFWNLVAWIEKVYPVSKINARKEHYSYPADPTAKDLGAGFQGAGLWIDLYWLNFFTNDPYDNMKYYGLVCSEIDPCSSLSLPLECRIGGMGMGDQAWGVCYSNTLKGANMPHELGHTFLGISHVEDNCGSMKPYFDDYTGSPKGKLEPDVFGFDGNTVYPWNQHYDMMTYCDPQWISTYTYKKLFNEFNNSNKSSAPEPALLSDNQEYLILSGILTSTGTIEKLKIHREILIDSQPPEQPETSHYTIELQNSRNETLLEQTLNVQDIFQGSDLKIFFDVIPFNPGTNLILIKLDQLVIHTIRISPNNPQVEIIYPNGGEFLSGTTTITWTAEDIDNDSLVFDVLYSTDNGINWSVLALNIKSNEFVWDTDQSPGSEDAKIRVMVSDGVNSAHDDSDSPFNLEKKGPTSLVRSPENNSNFYLNKLITFEGIGYDLEDGPINDSLFWTSSIDGFIGSGEIITGDSLSPGMHQITLTVKDSEGETGSSTLSILVRSVEDRDGDKIGDDVDNCPDVYNPDQNDADDDGAGDVCDNGDEDLDGYPDNRDNCPGIDNADQNDADGDGIGDACDDCAFTPYIGDIIAGEDNPATGSLQVYTVNSENSASYIWSLPEDWLGQSDSSSISVIVGNRSGIITVLPFNECGAGSRLSKSVQVLSTSTRQIFNENQISDADHFLVYPNPAHNVLNIYRKPDKESTVFITIFDILGKQMYNTTINYFTTSSSIDISNLNPGIYNITIRDSHIQSRLKFIKLK